MVINKEIIIAPGAFNTCSDNNNYCFILTNMSHDNFYLKK